MKNFTLRICLETTLRKLLLLVDKYLFIWTPNEILITGIPPKRLNVEQWVSEVEFEMLNNV